MKCKDCEHHYGRKSDNGYNKQKHTYHECLYPVKDDDGAVLALQRNKTMSSKEFWNGSPKWCPLKKSIQD